MERIHGRGLCAERVIKAAQQTDLQFLFLYNLIPIKLVIRHLGSEIADV